MKRVINFLKSETFVFLTLVFVLVAQIIHTMYIFETIRVADMSFTIAGYHVTTFNWVHALIFAVSIESAILMFILNGKRLPSKIYAVASWATNILYYGTWKLSYPEMAATIIASSMLAGSIWFFSDLFAEKIELLPYGRSEEDLKNFIAEQEQEERSKMAFKKAL
jgi:signal transduction histidine kinase